MQLHCMVCNIGIECIIQSTAGEIFYHIIHIIHVLYACIIGIIGIKLLST